MDLRIPAAGAPFRVEADSARLRLTVYGRTPPAQPDLPADSLLGALAWSAAGASAVAEVPLRRPLWGYKAFYDGGDLVLRLRRAPHLDPAEPLRGLRIVVDPGHPPAGATGPTGLPESQANLAIGLQLARLLRARGAEVLLTRTDETPVALGDRVRMAVDADADLLVSIHNNAFGEGANPERSQGTSTYYFHSFAAPLARDLDREIAAATGIPDLGAKWGNLALARPTWMPSVLTESLFMPMPRQESALRDPAFQARLAEAHLRGIEDYLEAVLSF